MVFSSMTFLFYFLPVLIAVYCIVPRKLKNIVLIIGNFVFYAWGEMRYIPFLIYLSVQDYICGRMMDKYKNDAAKKRVFLAISIIGNLALLIYFKYTNFFVASINQLPGVFWDIPKIMLPIGVSFNSFQSMSYSIDIYRGKNECGRSYIDYLCFTSLFPQIVAGPIVKFEVVGRELKNHPVTKVGFAEGIKRFLLGLGKKVLIANNVGFLWSRISAGQAGAQSVALSWIGILAYTFQIYFDFSGYSDMAVGLARVFGLTFEENFDSPYISKSVTEFWRRWHITLGNWFRDYVYIPLGGNRKGPLVQFRNIVIVWALTGLWHGAAWNFVLWGLYFAVFLVLEKFVLLKFWEKVPGFLRHVYTMLIVIVSWVIFYFEDISKIGAYIKGMFGFGGLPFWNGQALYYLISYAFIFVAAIYFSGPHFRTKVLSRVEASKNRLVWAANSLAYLAVFAACVAYLVNSTYNPFLYTRF
ncbi:MAG: MBOAT family protein [Oscillospiraceae bacterium]|jgi:alginate O-acetyltransferase complex protein AlgI|nr:MBOAT family protein [Oscillospiraceae bacterium]